VKRVDDRRVLNGIFWVLRSGARWADVPERYGPYPVPLLPWRETYRNTTRRVQPVRFTKRNRLKFVFSPLIATV